MQDDQQYQSEYFRLTKHSSIQYVVSITLTLVIGYALHFHVAMPLMKSFFNNFLQSEIVTDGREVEYRLTEESSPRTVVTSEYFRWAILDDSYKDSDKLEARYLFNPILSLCPVVATIALTLGVYLSALMPSSIGILRQKIEREIVNSLDDIATAMYGEHTDEELQTIIGILRNSDTRQLHDYSLETGVQFSDLQTLARAVDWRESGFPRSVFGVHAGIKFYMRSHFTSEYSNGILGLVYIGAAVLIIIIGIRGLKFIPASEPSIILFALGLEFILLITYALTLMYSRQEDEAKPELRPAGLGQADSVGLEGRLSEDLLRAFAIEATATPQKKS